MSLPVHSNCVAFQYSLRIWPSLALNHWDICSTRHAASVYKSYLPVFITGFLELSVSSESQAQSERRKRRGPLEPAVPKRNQNFTFQGQNGFPQLQNPRAWWLAEQSQPLLCCLPCEWRGKQLSTGHRAVCLAEQDPDSFRTLTLSIFLIERTSRCFTVLLVFVVLVFWGFFFVFFCLLFGQHTGETLKNKLKLTRPMHVFDNVNTRATCLFYPVLLPEGKLWERLDS